MKLLTTREAAEYLGYAKQTLNQWRSDGTGPKYLKNGKPGSPGGVRYKQEDLDEWMQKND